MCHSNSTEIYKLSRKGQSSRLCCIKGTPGADYFSKRAGSCQTSSCVSPTLSAELCSNTESIPQRFVKGSRLEYEEILRDTCHRGPDGEPDSVGVTALCCRKNSTELMLATLMGAEPREFPHQVKIKTPRGACAGSVYNERFILTAAHCTIDMRSKETIDEEHFKVILGSNNGDIDKLDASYLANGNQNESEFVYHVKDVIPHEWFTHLSPNFHPNETRYFYDIALLELDREIQFGRAVKAIQIAPSKFDPLKYADKAVIIGWGTTDAKQLSMHLQKGNIRIRNDSRCFGKEDKLPWTKYDKLGHQLLCLGGYMDGHFEMSAGDGDSGGPAICRGPDGRALLCGITSFGDNDTLCLKYKDEANCKPSVYTEVSNFYEWIVENAGEQNESILHKPFLYGEPISRGQYEHQVHITTANSDSCGGTLISQDVVITAAHCVSENDGSMQPLESIKISVGLTDLKTSEKGLVYKVKNVTTLPGFRLRLEEDKTKDGKLQKSIFADTYHENDLALLKLSEKVKIDTKSLPQLPLPNQRFSTCKEVSFTLSNTTLSGQLMAREFRLLPQDECERRIRRLGTIGYEDESLDENMMCGVEVYSGGSQCDRELGGGLLCKRGDNAEEYLFGIQVLRTCDDTIPNIFLQINLYTEWIQREVAKF